MHRQAGRQTGNIVRRDEKHAQNMKRQKHYTKKNYRKMLVVSFCFRRFLLNSYKMCMHTRFNRFLFRKKNIFVDIYSLQQFLVQHYVHVRVQTHMQ